MADRSKWKRLESVVRRIVHDWDPYGLLESGAPDDEWDNEILQIVGRVTLINTPADATNVISDVFTSAFQAEGFGQGECAEVGKKLFEALENAKPVHGTVADKPRSSG